MSRPDGSDHATRRMQEASAPASPTSVTTVVVRERQQRLGGTDVELVGTVVAVIIGIPVSLWSQERVPRIGI